jgi:hypothetical protein
LGDDEGADVVDKAPHRCALRGLTKMLAVVRGGADTLPYLIRLMLDQGNGKPFLVNRCGILLPQVRVRSRVAVAFSRRRGTQTCTSYAQRVAAQVRILQRFVGEDMGTD